MRDGQAAVPFQPLRTQTTLEKGAVSLFIRLLMKALAIAEQPSRELEIPPEVDQCSEEMPLTTVNLNAPRRGRLFWRVVPVQMLARAGSSERRIPPHRLRPRSCPFACRRRRAGDCHSADRRASLS
jgi:hypothetical protein